MRRLIIIETDEAGCPMKDHPVGTFTLTDEEVALVESTRGLNLIDWAKACMEIDLEAATPEGGLTDQAWLTDPKREVAP